jgi:energy-coupling factor transport system permease protein
MRLHPALQIIMWCLSLAVMQRLDLTPLCVLAGLMLCAGAWLAGRKMLQLFRRTRWIMFSLLLIYAYSTPGQPLFAALGAWSPAREGLLDGVTQLLRLSAALASLAILLDRLGRLDLISGLYSLFAVLTWFGWSRERCAIRLALTLHYAELAMLQRQTRWQNALQSLFEPPPDVVQPIVLPIYPFGWRDGVASIFFALFALGLILK